MIQLRSILNVADNTGAQRLSVIQVYGHGNRMKAYAGEIVTCVVKKAAAEGIVKNHEMVKAVIVRTRKETRRKDGSYIRFDDNAGPVIRELKELGFNKIVSMATEVY